MLWAVLCATLQLLLCSIFGSQAALAMLNLKNVTVSMNMVVLPWQGKNNIIGHFGGGGRGGGRKMQQAKSQIEAALQAASNLYTIPLGFGGDSTGGQFPAIIDTGSDLTWAPCNSNNGGLSAIKVPCDSSYCTSLVQSKCTADQTCSYRYAYGDGSSYSQGALFYRTLTFFTVAGAQVNVQNVAVGCSDRIQGIPESLGLLGLGRGRLSLLSQIGPALNHRFSYCLSTAASRLTLGADADSDSDSGDVMKFTSLLTNPASTDLPYYYVHVQGISLGGRRLNIPERSFRFGRNGSGGFVLDSGSQLTYLHRDAYEPLKREVRLISGRPEIDGSAYGLDLCFRGADLTSFPAITFHFGDGADLAVAAQNYLVAVAAEDAAATATANLVCLAVVPTKMEFSILGSMMQRGYRILYDNAMNRVGFAPANCDAM